jgi:hypothetical protein
MPAIDAVAYISAILKPLVRWCLRRGIRCAQVEQLLRQSFVREAEIEIQEAQSDFSVSKVSVMTGIHRSEVARLRTGDDLERGSHDVLNRVIGLWSSAKRYQTKEGKPKELSFEGLGSQFASLVADVSKEVTHYPILFELERIGAIEYVDKRIRLLDRQYTPKADHTYGLELLSRDVADLAAAIEVNLTSDKKNSTLHLRTAFDNIPPKYLPEIRAWILKQGAEFQSQVREYLSSFDRDMTGQGAEQEERARVSVSSFSYAEPIQAPKAISPKKRGRKPCSKK